jgi:hypothetical protein
LPALAQGLIMRVTGLSARELGGKREAQLLSAVAIAISGHALLSDSFLSYSSFNYLWWVLARSLHQFATVPLCFAGLSYVFARPEGRHFRLLGWMYAAA